MHLILPTFAAPADRAAAQQSTDQTECTWEADARQPTPPEARGKWVVVHVPVLLVPVVGVVKAVAAKSGESRPCAEECQQKRGEVPRLGHAVAREL